VTYVFDIDGTICSLTNGNYGFAIPYMERIERVNQLYDDGHTIIFHTARGMGRADSDQQEAINLLYDLTEQQLRGWEIKFHRLFLGKPPGDVYVDDKGLSDKVFFDEE